MKIKIYASYGVLAHEKCPVYSWACPASSVNDRITVDVPNVVGELGSGEPVVKLDGVGELPLSAALSNWGDKPALVWYDGAKNRHLLLRETAE